MVPTLHRIPMGTPSPLLNPFGRKAPIILRASKLAWKTLHGKFYPQRYGSTRSTTTIGRIMPCSSAMGLQVSGIFSALRISSIRNMWPYCHLIYTFSTSFVLAIHHLHSTYTFCHMCIHADLCIQVVALSDVSATMRSRYCFSRNSKTHRKTRYSC